MRHNATQKQARVRGCAAPMRTELVDDAGQHVLQLCAPRDGGQGATRRQPKARNPDTQRRANATGF
jgi:hypothetical protein